MDGIVEFATVRAPQIQAKVDRLLRQRDLDRAVIAEFQEELAKMADYHLEVEASRGRVRYWRGLYQESVREHQDALEKMQDKLDAIMRDRSSRASAKQVAKLQQELARSQEREDRLVNGQVQLRTNLARSRAHVKELVAERDQLKGVLSGSKKRAEKLVSERNHLEEMLAVSKNA